MELSVAEAKNRFSELLRAVEDGEEIVITRHGKPIAQVVRPLRRRRRVRLGTMKGRVQLRPGWDAPIDLDRFLDGDI